jgi:hypothetical protein
MARKVAKTDEPTADAALGGTDTVAWSLYSALLSRLKGGGGVRMEMDADPKKTCVHLVAGKGTAFLGIHPRAKGLLLTIVSESPIKSPRIRKAVQGSRHRCYNDLLVSSTKELDTELLKWIGASHALTNGTE